MLLFSFLLGNHVGIPWKMLRNASFHEITNANTMDRFLVPTKWLVSINSSKWGSTFKDLTKNSKCFSLSYLEVSSVLNSPQWLICGHNIQIGSRFFCFVFWLWKPEFISAFIFWVNSVIQNSEQEQVNAVIQNNALEFLVIHLQEEAHLVSKALVWRVSVNNVLCV